MAAIAVSVDGGRKGRGARGTQARADEGEGEGKASKGERARADEGARARTASNKSGCQTGRRGGVAASLKNKQNLRDHTSILTCFLMLLRAHTRIQKILVHA